MQRLIGRLKAGSFIGHAAKLTPAVLPVLAGILPDPARAQQPPTIPSQTRDDIDPTLRQAPPPPPSRLRVEGDLEKSPCALADPAYANIKITLSSAQFSNVGPVDPDALRPAYERHLGVERPIGVICDIRDEAASIIRDRGYLAAVQIPVQRIEGGSVRFEVLYARVRSIRVLGDPGRSERLVERYLQPLVSDQPFNRRDAERHILLARDIPGYDLRLALRPAGTAPGDMVGEVRIRHQPFLADLNIQNYAPSDTGRWGGQLRVQANGLTGMGDRTVLSVYSTADFEEQQVVQIGHDMLLGASGLKIGGRATVARARPAPPPGFPDISARTIFATFEVGYPVVRTQAATVAVAGGLELVDQRVRFGGFAATQDWLRIAFARVEAEAFDQARLGPGGLIGWRVAGGIELRRGLNILGASPNCGANPTICLFSPSPPSRVNADPTATLARGWGTIELRAFPKAQVAILPRWQVASAPLFPFEQYSVGNYTVGRGYSPGTLVGDNGAGFQVEMRLDGFRLLPKVNVEAHPYAFADNAWVWQKGIPGGAQRVSSLGGGMRLNIASRARLDLGVAVPMRRAFGQARKEDARFLMTFTSNLWPWGNR